MSDPVERLSPDDFDALVESWAEPARPRSKHLDLAVAAAFHRRRQGLLPLRDGEPIPGCDCPECTGIGADHPARVVPIRTRYRRAAYRSPLDVGAARAVPLLDVAERLGIRGVKRHGRSFRAPCPLHGGEGPNFSIDPARGLFHCFVCNEGGDGIRLVQRVRGCSFPEAVRELTGSAA